MIEQFFAPDALIAFFKVVMIDLVLAGDNAIVIGMAAAGLPKEMRAKAILVGIVAATVLRILFATVAVQLLQVIGLVLVGGILLLWVCWKMWRELQAGAHQNEGPETVTGEDVDHDGKVAGNANTKTFGQAAWQIVVADISILQDRQRLIAVMQSGIIKSRRGVSCLSGDAVVS